MKRWLIIGAGVIVGLFVVVQAGTYVYIHFIEADPPARLSLDESSTSSSGAQPVTGTDVDGAWTATNGSQAGYRVHENLHGQDNEAAGRTSQVTGTLEISGLTISAAEIVVDLASVTSDDNRRDNQYRNRIMDVSRFPAATFRLTQPITLPSVPTDTTKLSLKATGDLSLRGTTKSVTVDLNAQRDGASIKVQGAIPLRFDDWGIPSPSIAGISVDDHGEIEFLVVFGRG
jgi:polyisoprenoid-binding protein YceI